MSNLISVVIVDDDEMVAAAMSALCEKVKGVEVVGRANDGRDGLALVEKLVPQVALVDLMMPTLNGIDLVAMARQKGLPTRMVILTASRDPELCVRAMEAGAAAYLLKLSGVDELGIAIHAVVNGKMYITPEMAESYLRQSAVRPQPEHLTLRHREILQLVVGGRTNKEIAGILNVGVKTIEKHRAELMRRLGVHSTASLVWHAILHRLVMPPP